MITPRPDGRGFFIYNEYVGQYILILGDNKMSGYGEDDGEIILSYPTGLAILKVED